MTTVATVVLPIPPGPNTATLPFGSLIKQAMIASASSDRPKTNAGLGGNFGLWSVRLVVRFDSVTMMHKTWISTHKELTTGVLSSPATAISIFRSRLFCTTGINVELSMWSFPFYAPWMLNQMPRFALYTSVYDLRTYLDWYYAALASLHSLL